MTESQKAVGKRPAGVVGERVMFLRRNPENGEVEKVWGEYRGAIDPKVFERVGRRFLKLEAGGYFWPLDGMDAYGAAIQAVEQVAARIESGEVVLAKASPSTYLGNVGAMALLNFHQRRVQRARQTYRAVERRTMGRGSVGEDGFDIDNYDGTQDQPERAMCEACGEKASESIHVGCAWTAQQMVEQLPGVPWARERRDRAAALLGEICAVLVGRHPDVVRAFTAYVQADGNFVQAAHLAHIGVNRFYREWAHWLALARAVGESEKVKVKKEK